MEDEGWVRVRWPTDKDLWNPSSMEAESSKPLKITFAGPANHWTDALPIGNGRLGAMVWGGVASETIQLNEDTLWTGTPGNYTNPNAPEALSEVRKLVDSGKYAEATSKAVQLTGNPAEVYQLLGDIKLEFDVSHLKYIEETYHRELDLDAATIRVKYSVTDVEFTREHFASNPDQVIVTKISGSKPGSVSFSVSLDSKLHYHSRINGKNQIIMEGSCPGKRIPPAMDANDNPKGIQFSAILDIQVSNDRGVIHVMDDKKLRIEGSDWAVLLLVASSSFDGPFTKPSDSKRNPTLECLGALKPIMDFSYYDLYARHLDDYQNLFHRVSLQLAKSLNTITSDGSLELKKIVSSVIGLCLMGSNDDMVSTAERVKSFQSDEDPSLVELLFQYGRYLLISCSRPRTQVANLQGIWNRDIQPKWDGAPHLNINLEMNYWPSLPCNLSECQEPLFDFVSTLSVNGRKTAKVISREKVLVAPKSENSQMVKLATPFGIEPLETIVDRDDVNYEANGWVVHHKSDIWAKTSADQGDVVWALWPMGGAWLCTHLWDHYTYTLDKDFLKAKAYPLLNGCASFLLDWLIEGLGGYLKTNPSTSPEHEFVAPDGKPACVSYSSTMDMAIIKEVFGALVSAAEVLERDEDYLIQRVRKALPKLYPTKIAGDGSIMEWEQDFEDPDVHHRHLSHLFGLFPGHTITVEKTPDLSKAAEISLYKRGEEGPGWSTTWKAALWARLHNSEHAYRMVKKLINLVDPDHEAPFEGGLYGNLFAAHPPFQIDANFGFTAAVSEMLVQSSIRDLYLLPALPLDKWASGCVKGLKARGGITVSICWKEGDLHEVGLWSKDQNALERLHYRGTIVTANISSGIIYTFNAQLKLVKTCSL